MGRIFIDSLDDPRIAIYRSLKATNQTRRLEQFVVEGEKLVGRLLTSRFPIVSVMVTDRHDGKLGVRLSDEVPVYVVGHQLVDALVGFPFHRGVLASAEIRPWPSVEQMIEERATTPVTLVICPRISNPENLGAIARAADAFGVDAIVAGPSCPDPFSRRVLRVSMGSILQLPVIVAEQPLELADRLRRTHHFTLIAAVADRSAQPFDTAPRCDRMALVLGEEDQGIEAAWLERAEQIVTIPMRLGAGSLNVAMAAGILLEHLTRPTRLCDPRYDGDSAVASP